MERNTMSGGFSFAPLEDAGPSGQTSWGVFLIVWSDTFTQWPMCKTSDAGEGGCQLPPPVKSFLFKAVIFKLFSL